MKHLIEKYRRKTDQAWEGWWKQPSNSTASIVYSARYLICGDVLKDLIVEDVARRKVIKIILIVSGLVYPTLTVVLILLLS